MIREHNAQVFHSNKEGMKLVKKKTPSHLKKILCAIPINIYKQLLESSHKFFSFLNCCGQCYRDGTCAERARKERKKIRIACYLIDGAVDMKKNERSWSECRILKQGEKREREGQRVMQIRLLLILISTCLGRAKNIPHGLDELKHFFSHSSFLFFLCLSHPS